MDDLIGQTLGQFQIVREVGRGGMAVVYEAFQPALQRKVALKVLSPALSHDQSFVQRLHHEAVSAASLRHPNIVTIYDVGSQDRYHYIVMEYLDGRTLAEVIRGGGSIPLSRVASIVEQVAQALDYAHNRGFIHRDIKPSNIMLGRDDHATLTDFGIARAMSGQHLTQTGALMGTPEYMSPEQVLGEELDRRTDIYSLGIVVYEMLTGQTPFSGTTASVLYKQAHVIPPSPRNQWKTLDAAADNAVMRALTKRRQDRFLTAGEFAQALVGAPVGRSISTPPQAPPQYPTAVTVQPYGPPPQYPTTATVQPYGPPPQYPAQSSQGLYPSARTGGSPLPWLAGGIAVALLLCMLVGGGAWALSHLPSSTPSSTGGLGPTFSPIVIVVSATPDARTPAHGPSSPTPAPPVVTPALTRAQIEAGVIDAIERFQKAKEYSQKTGDTSHLSEVLAGQALERQVDLVRTTKSQNCYWDIFLQAPMRYEFLQVRGDNYVSVKVFKVETRHKYCNGSLDSANSVDKESYDTSYIVEQINGRWFVTQRE